MKKIVTLNGFNKKSYTLGEIIDILNSIDVKVNVDEQFDFSKVGKHYIIGKPKGKKK